MTAFVAPPLVERVAQLAAPWQQAYADSRVLPTAVLYAHFAALLVGGGLALAADRATLRAARGGDADARRRQLAELAGAHRLVVGALAALLASGALLFLADVETFATLPAFWAKMALVAALLGNGLAMTRAERALHGAPADDDADDRRWARLRTHAAASVALWMLTVLAGTVLTNA
jgi:hypothetical protein